MSLDLDHLAGHILLLSGHPGAGKTTTAEILAQLPGLPKVHLHSDDFWGYIKHGRIDPWLLEAHQQNCMVMQIVADVAGQYARHGYFVILDGVVRPNWLQVFVELGAPLHYVVMRTSEQEAVERCAARRKDTLSDRQVVANLHAQFNQLGLYEAHVLDVAGQGRRQALQAIVEALLSRAYQIHTPVTAVLRTPPNGSG
ncbi:MAG: AAA family ATPase [Rhizobium sp.]|nr:AAA family ATPase [Rhizobium sp.]